MWKRALNKYTFHTFFASFLGKLFLILGTFLLLKRWNSSFNNLFRVEKVKLVITWILICLGWHFWVSLIGFWTILNNIRQYFQLNQPNLAFLLNWIGRKFNQHRQWKRLLFLIDHRLAVIICFNWKSALFRHLNENKLWLKWFGSAESYLTSALRG